MKTNSYRIWSAAALAALLFLSSPSHAISVLYDFRAEDGSWDKSKLVLGADGNLYGTAALGGSPANLGTVFKFNLNGTFTKLATFIGPNGGRPTALVAGDDGNLYGTTYYGGANNKGTFFRLTPAGVLTTLVAFSGGVEGTNPGSLVKAVDGNFYGTTPGKIFRVSSTGVLAVIATGIVPENLFQASDGNFYGTSWNAVLRVMPGGTVTSLAALSGNPYTYSTGVVQGKDGLLYGFEASDESRPNYKRAFRLRLDGGGFEPITLSNSRGSEMHGPPIAAGDGNIYGEHFSDAVSAGSIVRLSPSGIDSDYALFDHANGSGPTGGLIQLTDGEMYGTTALGGAHGAGVVFRLPRPTTIVASVFMTLSPVAGKATFNPKATLTDSFSGAPVVNRRVEFLSNDVIMCSALTGPDGVAKCQPTVIAHVQAIHDQTFTVRFVGDAGFGRSQDGGDIICVGTICALKAR